MILSFSKAELVALSETVKEMMFVTQLLGRIMISVKLPVITRVDNTYVCQVLLLPCHSGEQSN